MISTECAIVIGLILLFQIADIIQLRGISKIVDDITSNVKEIKKNYKIKN